MSKTYTKVDRTKSRARAAACIASFNEAVELAAKHGLRLVREGDFNFRLTREKPRGIWYLCPRPSRKSPRIVGDPLYRGGVIPVGKSNGTLLEVAPAAIEMGVKP